MRPLHWLKGLGVGLGSLVAFAGSVVVHVGSAPGRRLAATIANQALAQSFRGRIVVDRIDTLWVPGGRIAASARIFDPYGHEVVAIDSVRARMGVAPLLGSLVSSGPLRVRISDVDVDGARIALLQSPNGGISLAETFQPKNPSPPDAKPGKGTVIDVVPVHVAGAHVSGDVVANLAADVRDMRAEVHVAPDAMTFAADHFDAEAAMLALSPVALHASGRAVLPAAKDALPRIAASLRARTGASTVDADVRVEDVVDARIRAHADPALARELDAPGPASPVDVDAHAKGPLDAVALGASVRAGAGTIDLEGHANVRTQDVRAHLRMHDVDAHAAVAQAPVSRISGTADVEAHGLRKAARARVRLAPGVVAGQATPAVDVDADANPARATAHVTASEAGTVAHVDASLDLESKARMLSVRADATSKDLSTVRGVPKDARGAVKLDAHANVALATGAVVGHAQSRVDGFAWGNTARAAWAVVDVDLAGSLTKPSATTSVHGQDVRVGKIVGDRVDAGGVVSFGSVDVDAAFVELQRGKTVLRADVSRVRVGSGGALAVEGARVNGLGAPLTADVHATSDTLAVRANGKGLRLEPLAQIGALPSNLRGGADLDVDVALDRGGVRGHANVRANGVQDGKETLRGAIALEGHGRAIDLESHVLVDPIGRVDIPRSEVRIDGDPRKPRTWARASGTVTAETDLDVAELAARFAPGSDLEAQGHAHARLDLTRKTPGGPVEAAVAVDTKGLAAKMGAMAVRGTDVHVRGTMDADRASVDLEAADARGAVFSTRAIVALRERGRRLPFDRAPIHATFLLPARSLDSIDLGDGVGGERARAAGIIEATGTLRTPHVAGWLRADLEGLGAVRIDELDAAWDRAREPMPHGNVVAKARVDLAAAARRLGDRVASLPSLRGLVDVDLAARRDEGNGLPSARAAAHTYGLKVAGERLAVAHTDVRASAEIHPATGEAQFTATAWDKRGAVALADAKVVLPQALTMANAGELAAKWREIPISARITLPPRPVIAYSPILEDADPKSQTSARALSQWRNVEGGVAFEASVEGTARAPKAIVRAYGLGLRQLERGRRGAPNRRQERRPVDAALYATYDGKRADVGFTVIDQGKTSFEAATTALVSAADMVDKGEATVRASADLRARAFEPASLPIIGSIVKGTFDGDIILRDYGTDARVEGAIKGRNVSIENVHFKTTETRIYAQDGKLAAAVGLEQPDGGWAGAQLTSAMKWGSAAAPTVDDTGTLRLDYKVDKFRLAGLRPLVRTVLPELDGRLDGSGYVARQNKVDTAAGSLSLRGGTAYVPTIGQNIEDAALDFRLGAGQFSVENASARIDRGEIDFAASGRIQGLTPTAVAANVRISDKRDLPIYIEGVRYGTVNGETSLQARLNENGVDVTADVPHLHFELAGLDPRSVQKLDPAERVRIGVRNEDGKLQIVRLQKLQKGAAAEANASTPVAPGRPITIHTRLGKDVIISQGTMLYVPMSGDVDVLAGGAEMKLKGKIALAHGGIINVKGRKFRIDNGTITWTEDDDVSDPVVIAAADWEAPDKTIVTASFTGPAKTGKLDLRSDPPHTNGEILSLLLFGTADGRTGGGGSVAGTAATAAGGVAAGGLSQAVSKLTDVEVEASVESPDASTTRPEVSVRVRPDVTLQVGYNIAPPAIQHDRVLLTVDWRLTQRWSLQATEGDRGTSIFDLLWQYRY